MEPATEEIGTPRKGYPVAAFRPNVSRETLGIPGCADRFVCPQPRSGRGITQKRGRLAGTPVRLGNRSAVEAILRRIR
jgi:hypothetical protein